MDVLAVPPAQRPTRGARVDRNAPAGPLRPLPGRADRHRTGRRCRWRSPLSRQLRPPSGAAASFAAAGHIPAVVRPGPLCRPFGVQTAVALAAGFQHLPRGAPTRVSCSDGAAGLRAQRPGRGRRVVRLCVASAEAGPLQAAGCPAGGRHLAAVAHAAVCAECQHGGPAGPGPLGLGPGASRPGRWCWRGFTSRARACWWLRPGTHPSISWWPLRRAKVWWRLLRALSSCCWVW